MLHPSLHFLPGLLLGPAPGSLHGKHIERAFLGSEVDGVSQPWSSNGALWHSDPFPRSGYFVGNSHTRPPWAVIHPRGLMVTGGGEGKFQGNRLLSWQLLALMRAGSKTEGR